MVCHLPRNLSRCKVEQLHSDGCERLSIPLDSMSPTSPFALTLTQNSKPNAEQPAADSIAQRQDWEYGPWATVAAHIKKSFEKRTLAKLFPFSDPGGGVLRWGLAISSGRPVTALQIALSELADGRDLSRWRGTSIQWELAVEEFQRDIQDLCRSSKVEPSVVAEAVLWAYALPPLISHLRETSWKALCQSLDALARHCLSIPDVSSPARLIGGCELSLVLRMGLGDLASTAMAAQAVEGLEQWCQAGEAAIGSALQGAGRNARLVAASVLRQQRLAAIVARRKFKKRELGLLSDLGCWVAGLTRRDTSAVFSSLSKTDSRDDIAPDGLFNALQCFSPKLLGPTMEAVLGNSPADGGLAWKVSLPETLWHSELAGTAVMLAEWDVRRGRTFVDYATDVFRLEVEHGKGPAICGAWEVFIDVDGMEQSPAGPWTYICEYSDDDAQYLEFEQRWTGGVRLQRQLMLLREDRCVLLADAVLRDETLPSASISYIGRIPLAEPLEPEMEAETTEIWLRDRKHKPRCLVLSPLANEWRQGPSAARVELTPDHHIRLRTSSSSGCDNGGGVFAPLWLDFQQRRYDRPRTWRQLTVADDLRLVDADEAVAQRIQMGSEHWVLYRSLRGERTRTFLGKHLVADFYCARFHPGDGRMEDLLTVGDHDEDIERAAAENAAPVHKPL